MSQLSQLSLSQTFHVEQIAGFVARFDFAAKPKHGMEPAEGKKHKKDDGHKVLRYDGDSTIKHFIHHVKGFVSEGVCR